MATYILCGIAYSDKACSMEKEITGLNRRASGRAKMPLYMLIHLLHKEACLVALQIQLVSEKN